jgi:hypothetical protein
MSDNSTSENVPLAEAQKLLSESLNYTPDKETLVEWIKLGYLVGEERDSEFYISKDSLANFTEQLQKNLETKRGARLALHAVDIWKREDDNRAIAVTLASKTTVVTTEKVCKESNSDMLTAAAQATLDAITEILENKLSFELVQVKHHSISKMEQSLVAVLLNVDQKDSSKKLTLSGVAMVEASTTSVPLQAAARATLNALNRTLTPYVTPQTTWRDMIRKFLPV